MSHAAHTRVLGDFFDEINNLGYIEKSREIIAELLLFLKEEEKYKATASRVASESTHGLPSDMAASLMSLLGKSFCTRLFMRLSSKNTENPEELTRIVAVDISKRIYELLGRDVVRRLQRRAAVGPTQRELLARVLDHVETSPQCYVADMGPSQRRVGDVLLHGLPSGMDEELRGLFDKSFCDLLLRRLSTKYEPNSPAKNTCGDVDISKAPYSELPITVRQTASLMYKEMPLDQSLIDQIKARQKAIKEARSASTHTCNSCKIVFTGRYRSCATGQIICPRCALSCLKGGCACAVKCAECKSNTCQVYVALHWDNVLHGASLQCIWCRKGRLAYGRKRNTFTRDANKVKRNIIRS